MGPSHLVQGREEVGDLLSTLDLKEELLTALDLTEGDWRRWGR